MVSQEEKSLKVKNLIKSKHDAWSIVRIYAYLRKIRLKDAVNKVTARVCLPSKDLLIFMAENREGKKVYNSLNKKTWSAFVEAIAEKVVVWEEKMKEKGKY